jgi:hypothetical protein
MYVSRAHFDSENFRNGEEPHFHMIICLLSIHENVLNDQMPANLVFEFAGTHMHSLIKSFPKRRVAEARITEKCFFFAKKVLFESLIAYLDTFALSILLRRSHPARVVLIKYRTHVAGPINESL